MIFRIHPIHLTLFAFNYMIVSILVLHSQSPEQKSTEYKGQNILSEITKDKLGDLQWENEPAEYTIEKAELIVKAPKDSDFFINPEDLSVAASAPVLYKEISGDFVATTWVSPDMTSVWNAAGLLLMIDSDHWIKLVFENSDATGPGIVTVTTRGVSDDANGVRLNNRAKIGLKMVRKGNNYAMYWAEEGKGYKMARLSAMPASDAVKIGLEAQCPAGEEAIHKFHYFSIESKTVKDLRKGE